MERVLQRSGRIDYSHLVYLRPIKEALEKQYRLMILEESPHYLKVMLKQKKWWFFTLSYQQAILHISIVNNAEKTSSTLHYTLFWMQYYLFLVVSAVLGGTSFYRSPTGSVGERMGQGIGTFLLWLLFFGAIAFFDLKMTVSRIRKILAALE